MSRYWLRFCRHSTGSPDEVATSALMGTTWKAPQSLNHDGPRPGRVRLR